MLLRAIAVWLVIMVLAVVNGGAREALLNPRLGQQAGQVLSTAILCVLILLVAWLATGWIAPGSWRGAVLVGAAWVALTLAFEFLAGHYLFGDPWERLLAEYNVFRGRIWPLVPFTSFVSPVLAYWRRHAA